MDANLKKNRSFLKDAILPILIWVGMIFAFLNVKHIPIEFNGSDAIVFRYAIKFVFTIALPLLLIYLLYKDKRDFGIYFPKYTEGFKLAFKGFSLAGPACISFLIIGALGWSYEYWQGALVLSIAFFIVLYFIPKVTANLSTRDAIGVPNKRITFMTWLSVLTIIIAYFTYDYAPVISKLLYYTFIVGFGEELFFRGYIQSSLNKYFGKPFYLKGVSYGWGLIVSAVLFGLSHALVTVPPTWPWAIWTAILGFTLGYIREKEGSILAAVLLHAMIDFPLAFIS
ncbi:CPBP family intramembrane metalloprotease [Flavobacteriaceae bacterium AU392]|nr:CPBP family intramembrane metalloprotease [Flavobacteriaceae bacterium]RKM85851.1 CPBP family intramembrane metalloprotease [Flavobacteriaceae bacterium AU392]